MRQTFQRKRHQSSQTADHVVVTYFPVERVHLPRTNNHEVVPCCVVVLEEAATHGVVNDHEVQLEDGSDHDEQRVSSDREQRKNHDQQRQWLQEEEKSQRQIAQRNTKSKKDDGRWVTILGGLNPSSRQEHTQLQARMRKVESRH